MPVFCPDCPPEIEADMNANPNNYFSAPDQSNGIDQALGNLWGQPNTGFNPTSDNLSPQTNINNVGGQDPLGQSQYYGINTLGVLTGAAGGASLSIGAGNAVANYIADNGVLAAASAASSGVALYKDGKAALQGFVNDVVGLIDSIFPPPRSSGNGLNPENNVNAAAQTSITNQGINPVSLIVLILIGYGSFRIYKKLKGKK